MSKTAGDDGKYSKKAICCPLLIKFILVLKLAVLIVAVPAASNRTTPAATDKSFSAARFPGVETKAKA